MTTVIEELRDAINNLAHQDIPLQSIKGDLNELLDEVDTMNGGSQPFIYVQLVHSADFANPACFVPITAAGDSSTYEPQTLVLPPSNTTDVSASVGNVTVDAKINATLIVQNANGSIWIELFCSPDELFMAGDNRHLDTSTNEGGAGVGLSWNVGGKRVDIADVGAHSAFLIVRAYLA